MIMCVHGYGLGILGISPRKVSFSLRVLYHCNPVQGLELGLSGSFVKADPSN